MLASLELVGERGADIVPTFFERFYARFPDQRERFCNRASSEGLMVNEMLGMLMAQAGGEPWVDTMMRAQVYTHHDHGEIILDSYRAAMDLLVEVLEEAAGAGWESSWTAAWQESADGLFAVIAKHY